MVTYDDIIFRLQSAGGVSEVFRQLQSRIPESSFKVLACRPRYLYRYLPERRVKEGIFHSTYYRVATNSKAVNNVTTVHDFVYERFVSGLKKCIHSSQKKQAISTAQLIICVSRATRDDLAYFYGEKIKAKAEVVYNGVSEEFRNYGYERSREDVLFVGSRSGYKNFANLVRALYPFPPLNLIVVGGGALSRPEKRLLNRWLPNRYSVKEYCTKWELVELYNRSLFFAYPSLYEGFGLPIVEAMACGCPVLSVASPATTEVAGGAACTALDGSPYAIGAAVKRLLDLEYRNELSGKGSERSEYFSWSRCAAETQTLYSFCY